MKLHQLPNGLMVTALTATVLLAGAAGTTARDRDGNKRHNPRIEQHDRQNRNDHSVNRQVRHRRPAHENRVTVRAPSRRIIHALPSGCRTIRTPGHHHYFHKGAYYIRHPHGFELVGMPRFLLLPPHARRVIINGTVYYFCDDVYYIHRDGFYEVCDVPHVRSSSTFGAWPFSITLTDY